MRPSKRTLRPKRAKRSFNLGSHPLAQGVGQRVRPFSGEAKHGA